MRSPSPLQNRVRPDGEIVAVSARGTFLGNRGGVIHDSASRTLLPRKRWASRQWISCVTEFKGRKRTLMSPNSYTELFFLDEVTALAAGHRPCFECRRRAAMSFAEAWRAHEDADKRAYASYMDQRLQKERLDGRVKKVHMHLWSNLPTAAFIRKGDNFIAKGENGPLLWSFEGYKRAEPVVGEVACLTPPSILGALTHGYAPHWHPSAYRV